MATRPIISRRESLQILGNHLRKQALEKRAAELKEATPERRTQILVEVAAEVQKELQKQASKPPPNILLH